MNEENLTTEQKQAVTILEDRFNNISILCDWIQRLNETVLFNFFGYDIKDIRKLIENIELPKTEKAHLLEIIDNYNTYQLYIELSDYLATDLKSTINNIVDSAFCKGTS